MIFKKENIFEYMTGLAILVNLAISIYIWNYFALMGCGVAFIYLILYLINKKSI